MNAAGKGNVPASHSFVISDLRERGLDENIEAGSNVEETYEHKSERPWRCFKWPLHIAKSCVWACFYFDCRCFNPLNAEFNPISHLLALLGAHHILHVSSISVKWPRHIAKSCVWACFYVDCTTLPLLHTYIYTHKHTRAQRVEPERSTISVETITNLLFSMV